MGLHDAEFHVSLSKIGTPDLGTIRDIDFLFILNEPKSDCFNYIPISLAFFPQVKTNIL